MATTRQSVQKRCSRGARAARVAHASSVFLCATVSCCAVRVSHVSLVTCRLELEDPRHRPQLFLCCLNGLLDLLDDRHSLWTTCGVSAIFWNFWMIGTCLCALGPVSSRPSSGLYGWSGPVSASLLARRYRSRCWH